MGIWEEVVGAIILTLITLLVIGIILIIYYSLGLPSMTLFLFLVYLFLVRSINFQITFNRFDP
jgi:ABC-type uncharacterized transport system permease subunit